MKKKTLKQFVFEMMEKEEVITDQKVVNFLNGEIPNLCTVNEYKRQYLKQLKQLKQLKGVK